MHPSASIVAFVAVSDLDRAEQFYGQTLGLSLTDERPFAMVADVGGTMLRITAVDHLSVGAHTVLGWAVDDLDAAVAELVGRGVEFIRYVGMEQDGQGVWTSPNGSRIAWFFDVDGNTLSLTQFSS
jgi:predicted enzyme related to lactoylglutathione lyase